jgi:hypothetical protein
MNKTETIKEYQSDKERKIKALGRQLRQIRANYKAKGIIIRVR